MTKEGLSSSVVPATLSDPVPTEWVEVGQVEKLYIYPLKSAKGIQVQEAEAGPFGLCHGKQVDRRLLVVDQANRMVTARKQPKLVLVKAQITDDDYLLLEAPGEHSIRAKLPSANDRDKKVDTEVWSTPCSGFDVGADVGRWISSFLTGDASIGMRVVYHADQESTRTRNVEGERFKPFVRANDVPYFADGFGFLLISDAMISEINRRLSDSNVDLVVEETRFRPNIYIKSNGVGGRAFEEDTWTYVRVGDRVLFRNCHLCPRCVFTTVDPFKGQLDARGEPLKTLRTFRSTLDAEERKKYGTSPFVGINLGVDECGTIKNGDKVYIGK